MKWYFVYIMKIHKYEITFLFKKYAHNVTQYGDIYIYIYIFPWGCPHHITHFKNKNVLWYDDVWRCWNWHLVQTFPLKKIHVNYICNWSRYWMDVKSTWIPTWHQMDHVSCPLGLFSKPPLGGRPNTKLGDHDTSSIYSILSRMRIRMNKNSHWNGIWLRTRSHMTSHHTWGSVTPLHDFGGCFRTAFGHFSFGLSPSHGHGSWRVCVVALGPCPWNKLTFKFQVARDPTNA